MNFIKYFVVSCFVQYLQLNLLRLGKPVMFSLEGMSSCLYFYVCATHLQLRLSKIIIKLKKIDESERKLLFF